MEFKKYSKIYRVGHDEIKELLTDDNAVIHVEEKIDGANFRFYISKEGKIIIGSRTKQLTSNEGEDTNMNKMFIRCSNYVREKLKDNDLSDFHGLIFYGENTVRHTINYDWDKIPPFLGFDIYDTTEGKYLDFETKTEIFKELGLETVPYLGVLNIDKSKDIHEQLEEVVPISKYSLESAKDRKAEGIVLKDYDRQIFAKFVRDAFKEKNAEVFGGNPKYNKTSEFDNEELIFKFCTNPRIEKQIFKLIDEGHKLEMSLMKFLPKNVWNDIIEEEWREILTSNWKLDMKGIRKLIPKRCKAVLEQMITNNSLNDR